MYEKGVCMAFVPITKQLVNTYTDDDRFSSVVVSASGKSDIDSTEHRAKKNCKKLQSLFLNSHKYINYRD